MEEVRHKTTKELAKMLGIKSYDANKVSMQLIYDNVSPTLRPKVKAAIELYKRSLEEIPVTITNAKDVIGVVRPLLMDLEHEEVWALMLDNAMHVIDKVMITKGTSRASLVDVNGICRKAIKSNAAAVILAHNHPSGDPMPGQADIEETRRLKMSLKIVDIALIDHVVIAKGGAAYSFAEEIVIE